MANYYGWVIENIHFFVGTHFFVAALLHGIANIGHTYQTKAVSQYWLIILHPKYTGKAISLLPLNILLVVYISYVNMD
jgi:hypothetical protein